MFKLVRRPTVITRGPDVTQEDLKRLLEQLMAERMPTKPENKCECKCCCCCCRCNKS